MDTLHCDPSGRRESFGVFTFRTCFITQPAGRARTCQGKARNSWSIFRKISLYKLMGHAVQCQRCLLYSVSLFHISHTECDSEMKLRKWIRNYWKSKPAWNFDILMICFEMRRADNSVRRVYGAPHIFETNHHLPSLRLPMVEWNVALALPRRGVPKARGARSNERTGQKSDELRPRGHYGHASKRGGQDRWHLLVWRTLKEYLYTAHGPPFGAF